MSEITTVADLKKRMRLVVNTLTKDYDGFNHLDSISKKLMEIEGDIDYMTDKISMRIEKASVVEVKPEIEVEEDGTKTDSGRE